MRIQHNIAAINSHRNLGGNNDAVSKNLEKLSSGFRINKAGDDAAGLAISEKMRAQIKGLETAQKNAQDGISLVQTAEGNLTEVHSMLNRMVELATQSANGTYDNTTDRANLQKEVESLKKEIDRISESANYNGIKLLDGSLGTTSGSAANGAKEIRIGGDATNVTWNDAQAAQTGYTISTGGTETGDVYEFTYTDKEGKQKTFTLTDDGTTLTATGAGGLGTALANALSGQAGASFQASDAEKVREFSQLFNVKVDADGVLIVQSKHTGTSEGGSFGGVLVKNSNGAVQADQLMISASADKTKLAENASVSFSAGATGGSFTIGDKNYRATTNAALYQQLLDDGIEATFDLATSTIKITSLDKITVDQRGSGVSSSNDLVEMRSVDPTKNEFSVTISAGATTTNGDYTLKLDYIDENGKAQSKDISYKDATAAGSTSATLSQVLEAAISADEDLAKLFEVSRDNQTITITAKTPGGSGAKITGIETSDQAAGTATVFTEIKSTDGTNAGTKISLSKDRLMDAAGNRTDGNFESGDTITINGKTYEFVQRGNAVSDSKNTAVYLGSDGDESLEELSKVLKENGVKVTFDKSGGAGEAYIIVDNEQGQADKGGLVLQVGETNEDFQKVTVQIGSMDSKSLGIADINIGDQTPAGDAIGMIKEAINKVSSTRGDLGAIQNRLEHTINNLGVTTENMTAAESRIRDVDMAKEMMDFTKNNILTQAAQAMLAQANQIPQGVLQLLR